MLLVEGIYLLSQDVIHIFDIERADTCLNIFVSMFGELYGNENVTFNVHQLLHLADTVTNWGPVWCYSAYIFEGYMQQILKMFHGTQAVPLQIANRFDLFGNIISVSGKILASDLVDDRIKHFLQEKLFGIVRFKKAVKVDEASLVGLCAVQELEPEDIYLIQQLLQADIEAEGTVGRKVICNGMKICSRKSQLQRSRRNNHTVVTKGDMVLEIDYFLAVNSAGKKVCVAVGHPLVFQGRLIPPHPIVRNWGSHIREFVTRERKAVCLVTDIRSKCSVIKASDHFLNPICCVHHGQRLTT
jgi:hypothetical protein